MIVDDALGTGMIVGWDARLRLALVQWLDDGTITRVQYLFRCDIVCPD